MRFAARPVETVLTARARDFLAAGPRDVVSLIGHVCQLPNPPRTVAEHMAIALFESDPMFARDADGRWLLLDRATGRCGTNAMERADDEVLSLASYAVIDVETTGGRPSGADRITEVAAVVVEHGRITRRFETLVNPERPIPSFITALTGISSAMVRHAPRFRDMRDELLDVLAGKIFVGHNAAFDWKFVESEVARVDGRVIEGRRLCTVRMARRLLPQLRRRSLDHVAHYFGIDITGRHRAGGDAEATARVLLRLLGVAADRDCTTWGALHHLLTTPRRRVARRRSALPGPVDRDPTA
jgi:DNA polymerase-3 subunit epsilon